MSTLKLTPDELRSEMGKFIGTEGYHRVSPFYPHVLLTDGMKWFAETVGCFWLLDLFGTEPGASKAILAKLKAGEDEYSTTFLRVSSKDGKATISLDLDSSEEPFWRQRVDLTDFPEGDWTFYVSHGGDIGGRTSLVLMLPSEY